MFLSYAVVVLFYLDDVRARAQIGCATILKYVCPEHVNIGWSVSRSQTDLTHNDPPEVESLCIRSVVGPIDLLSYLVYDVKMSRPKSRRMGASGSTAGIMSVTGCRWG